MSEQQINEASENALAVTCTIVMTWKSHKHIELSTECGRLLERGISGPDLMSPAKNQIRLTCVDDRKAESDGLEHFVSW